MVTKPAKADSDSIWRRKVKENMNMELAVDAMELPARVNHIVLFSGDGDFRPLVSSSQRQGLHVSVGTTIHSHPPMTSDELHRQVCNSIDLEELKNAIGRPPRESPLEPQSLSYAAGEIESGAL